MAAPDWSSEDAALIGVLTDRLGGKESCSEVVDGYEELMASIWTYAARLLSDGGMRAVVSWSIQVAGREALLLQALQVCERGVDFDELRDRVAQEGCDTSELLEAFLRLGVAVFQTLSELTGDTVTEPLLHHLEEM